MTEFIIIVVYIAGYIASVAFLPFVLVRFEDKGFFTEPEDIHADILAVLFFSFWWPVILVLMILAGMAGGITGIMKANIHNAIGYREIRKIAHQIYEDNKAGSTRLMTWRECMKEAKKTFIEKLKNASK